MNKPHITKYKWREYVGPRLSGKGVEREYREKMEMLLAAEFDKDRGDDWDREGGINAEEIAEAIANMKKYKDVNHIPLSQIEILEEVLQKVLKEHP